MRIVRRKAPSRLTMQSQVNHKRYPLRIDDDQDDEDVADVLFDDQDGEDLDEILRPFLVPPRPH